MDLAIGNWIFLFMYIVHTAVYNNGRRCTHGVYKTYTYLKEKEVFFNHIIEEFISSRRQLIVRQFLDALTVGGPGGTPRQGLLLFTLAMEPKDVNL